ncbi:MAG: DUF6504 family protein [Thermoleophilia bacterium]
MTSGGATHSRAGARQDPLIVTWHEHLKQPRAFVWRRHRYLVERVLQTWIIETGWWQDDIRISRHYWRVVANSRTFDLFYDRLGKAWHLERALS